MGSHCVRALTAAAATLAFGATVSCGGGQGDGGSAFDAGIGLDATFDSNGADTSVPMFGDDGGGSDGARGILDAQGTLAISPSALQTITVAAGQNTPTVPFAATWDGTPVSAGWVVDRGDLGSVSPSPSPTTTFVPGGSTGGLVTVTAGYNGKTATAQVLIQLTAQQNGGDPNSPSERAQIPMNVAQLTGGGGVGGVGGEGLGGAVTDPGTVGALQNPSGNGQAQGLTFLYPYDKTVWPRGMLAPLLMWRWSPSGGSSGDAGGSEAGTNGDAAATSDGSTGDAGTGGDAGANTDAGSSGALIPGDADAVRITLSTTSGSFSWRGTFGRPAILQQTGGAFIRHPIPQDVWDMATNTAGGLMPGGGRDHLTVSLTVAKNGVAYGPISETWTIAAGRLPGIIYYNSYGSQLAQNFGGAVGGNHRFGGAVLSIHVGDTAPQLVAGSNGGAAQCRTCHSVAAGGSRLVVQRGDDVLYSQSSAYDLTPQGSVEHLMTNASSFFPGVYPDGSVALTASGQILPLPTAATLPTVTGLSTVATNLGTPAFSPDGKLVAFNPLAGPGVTAPRQEVMVMGFDLATNAFSNPTVVVDDTGKAAAIRPGFPAFFPDAKSLVFHHQSAASVEDSSNLGALPTRAGSKAQVAWTSVADAAHVTPLDALNGKDAAGNVYLPKLGRAIAMSCTADGYEVGNVDPDHGDDVDLNYEPTVNPVPSGGFVWVVFTSRRMYGSEATIPPFCSDPRGVDLIQSVTTKKLWVAAVDVGATPGTDASHPAFYLPAQELLAGNSRGFWVLDPCRKDGQSCQSGDQCCNGYCTPAGDGGALVCANTPPNGACSALYNKCMTAADCCDPGYLCINGFCSQGGIH